MGPTERVAPGAWVMVALLTATATLAYLDRQLFNLFSQDIKQDLALTDTRLGLLQGMAFSLFYGVMSFPIARVADRGSRKTVIVLSVVFWSVAAAASALTRSFASLFLVRAAIASGEAGVTPSASAMIADSFHRSLLALPISVYLMSIYFGSTAAMLLGALIHTLSGSGLMASVPLLGEMAVWRSAFVVAGALGIPMSLLLCWCLKEPQRSSYTDQGQRTSAPMAPASLAEVFAFVRSNRAFFLAFFSGSVFLLGAVNAVWSWTPTVFIRIHEASVAEAGYTFGVIFFIGGVAGSLAAGAVSRGRRVALDDSRLIVLTAGCGLGLLLAQGVALTQELPFLYYAFLSGLSIFFMAPCISLPPAILQSIAPANMRAQITATFLMVTGVFGLGLGPVAVGLGTDRLFSNEQALHQAVALSSVLFCALGGALLLLSRAHYRELILRVR